MINFLKLIVQSKLGLIGLVIFVCFVIVAVFAPIIAPYGAEEKVYISEGKLKRLQPPSFDHFFGTTLFGRDVFSQVIWGARPGLLIGLFTALGVVCVGVTVGLISGYYGGWRDNLLMRITDVFWGLPSIPFVVVIMALLKGSLYMMIFSMAIVLWRSPARVIRSQVLTLRERPFVDAAKISGASTLKIIFSEIAPNIMPLALVNTVMAVGNAIIIESSVSFLGFGDPSILSWGGIIQQAFASQMVGKAWWWVLAPGGAIMALVTAIFIMGRTYEEKINPRLKKI